MVGAEPVIWMANEGEAVTETEDITESTRTDVFLQFTEVFIKHRSGQRFGRWFTNLKLPR